MHFVTGGAFQGKRKWVKDRFDLDEQTYTWINGYEEDVFMIHSSKPILILEGCEEIIRRFIQEEAPHARVKWTKLIQFYKQWQQQDSTRTVIFIGCDIGLGIVPIKAERRLWRDVVGWCYQDTAHLCTSVTTIWAGIGTQLKGE
jgi:adenosylcobinamide kinase / adenosylcobinamide-phosphate guanylyltransferase